MAKDIVREIVEDTAPDESAGILDLTGGSGSLAGRLERLPKDVRRRLDHGCVELLASARTQERREAALWTRALLSSRPLRYFEDEGMEPMLTAVVEGGDVVAACEMVLEDKKGIGFSEKLKDLPEHVRLSMFEVFPDLYESAGSAARREFVLLAHTFLSFSLNRPVDRLMNARQKILKGRGVRASGVYTYGAVEMAWVELASGRSVPVELGAKMRREYAGGHPYNAKALKRTVPLLNDHHPPLNASQPWADRALAEPLCVRHAVTAKASRPSAAWERKGRVLLAGFAADEFRDRALDWLSLMGDPRTVENFDDHNHLAARGLVWLLSFLPEEQRTVRDLGSVLETSLRKAPGMGPVLPKLANACENALGAMEGRVALAEIARLTTRVTYRTTLGLLEKALEARARALNVSREDIEELSVPDFGLTEVGRRVEDFGGTRVELVIDRGRADLRWYNAAGKRVKSVPAAVRREHPEELKELKADAKAANLMLSAVAKRLDRLFLTEREWEPHEWWERYFDHPLVGTLARRLIWTVDGVACAYVDGALRDLSGGPVTPRGGVRLWHPVGRTVEEILAWRERLEAERVTQPFKQAHREVYLLTDAERCTGTYSNRFAGHILRQYPFRSLAAERGWRDELRYRHHDLLHSPTMLELPEWGIRAEYRVHGEGVPHEARVTESGAYELLAADQVRFYPIDAPHSTISTNGDSGFSMPARGRKDPVPLTEVPERVLSEVLPDVDLFVGVTSIGNDPTWQDGGPDGRYRGYWSSYGFGSLSETARTRHDLLVRLLPRLAIGDRCHVEGRYLHVKGELHSYRIHLGSGNVLIDPGDRYLCIVAGRASTGSTDTCLPFEGDGMLSLILSKALLLGEDTKITDPTILSQL